MTSWYESAFHITGPLGGTQLVTIMLSYVLTPRLPGSKLRDDLIKAPLKSCQEHTEMAYRKSYLLDAETDRVRYFVDSRTVDQAKYQTFLRWW